jgi:hypothetical protein
MACGRSGFAMRRVWVATALIGHALWAGAAAAETVSVQETVRVGAFGKALLSIKGEPDEWEAQAPIASAPAPSIVGNARVAMLVGGEGDQLGLGVSRVRGGGGRSASAVLGMWSGDGAIEFGAFQDQAGVTATAGAAQTVQLVSGRRVRARGVRLTGSFYGSDDDDARGWSLALDARRQQTPDYVAAMRGLHRSSGESRVALKGLLRF